MFNTPEGIHVTPAPTGSGWVNEANGVILSRHRDKATAIARGQQLAKRYATLLTIHRKDGNVILTRSYATAQLPQQ